MLIQIIQKLPTCLRDLFYAEKNEVVLGSRAALEVFGERVRKALQSELFPGGGEVPTRTRAFVCWTNIAK